MLLTRDPTKLLIVFGIIEIKGLKSTDCLKTRKMAPNFKSIRVNHGSVPFRCNDKRAFLELSIFPEHPVNHQLTDFGLGDLYTGIGVVPLVIARLDGLQLYGATQARISKMPDLHDLDVTPWEFELYDYREYHGGQIDVF